MASPERDAQDEQAAFHNEKLDPRIQDELEKLNLASDEINKLELELDEARASFRQVLTDSTHRLKGLSKKLGSCIEKARPYYEARMRAKEELAGSVCSCRGKNWKRNWLQGRYFKHPVAQVETQHAALRFERACSQLAAAKEMVFLAEQGFFNKGQPFDPAWQEMLNHATMKVNDAEKERLEGEVEHRTTAMVFNQAEQEVKALQKELKRNIAKSRPYFELKAAVNHQMQDQKERVGQLEIDVTTAKKSYSSALRSLEAISDRIHEQRKEAQLRLEMGTRSEGVGAEAPEPPPTIETSSEESLSPPCGHTNDGVQVDQADSAVYNVCRQCSAKSAEGFSHKFNHRQLVNHGETKKHPLSEEELAVKQSQYTHKPAVNTQGSHLEKCSNQNVTVNHTPGTPRFLVPPALDIPTVNVESATSEGSSLSPTFISPDPESESDVDRARTIRTNAEIMESLQRAKGAAPRPFLRPNRGSRDSLLDETADTDSLTGSMASVSMLDDEQVESLMVETGEYLTFLTRLDEQEKAQWSQMSLPSRLAYLETYMKSRPEWVMVNEGDASVDREDFCAGHMCSRDQDCSSPLDESNEGSVNKTDLPLKNVDSTVIEREDSQNSSFTEISKGDCDSESSKQDAGVLNRKLVTDHPLVAGQSTGDNKSNTVTQITHLTHL